MEISISRTVSMLNVYLPYYLVPAFGKLPNLLLAFFFTKTLEKKHNAKILKFHCSNMTVKKISCIEVRKVVKRCLSDKMAESYLQAV